MDVNNNKVRKVVVATRQVTTFAGDGTSAFLDGPLLTARFSTIGDPAHCTVDPGGRVWVSDNYNNRVRILTP